jgi:hypothetical protein
MPAQNMGLSVINAESINQRALTFLILRARPLLMKGNIEKKTTKKNLTSQRTG